MNMDLISSTDFRTLYAKRLDLSLTQLEVKSTSSSESPARVQSLRLKVLQRLQESHLSKIPFENLSQHEHSCISNHSGGGESSNEDGNEVNNTQNPRYKLSLDLDEIADRVLVRQCGGVCFQLNTLFAYLLTDLDLFDDVRLVPATLFKRETFRHPPTHVVIMVRINDDESVQDGHGRDDGNNDNMKRNGLSTQYSWPYKEETHGWYYVDVAFGEPPLHPIEFRLDGVCQTTPEGMKNRFRLMYDDEDGDHQDFVDNTIGSSDDDDDGDSSTRNVWAVYEWYLDGRWQPRLRWKIDCVLSSPTSEITSLSASSKRRKPGGMTIDDMAPIVDRISRDESPFVQKFICCRLTRQVKYTVAGDTFKVTGPPRFPMDDIGGIKNDNEYHAVVKHANTYDIDLADHNVVERHEKLDVLAVRHILHEMFDISKSQTQYLDISESIRADTNVWSHV